MPRNVLGLSSILAVAIAGASACSLLPSTPENQATQSAIKVGVVWPQTGELSELAATAVNGIELAVNHINENGGVLDRPLEYILEDSESNIEASRDAVRQLIETEGVTVVLGPLASSRSLVLAQEITIPSRVVHLSFASTSPLLTELSDNDLFFRTIPSDAYQGVALAAIARDKRLERIAILYRNDAYGEGFADSVEQAFTARGGTITGILPFEPQQDSYEAELSQLQVGNPEILVLIAFPESGTKIFQEAVENGYFDRFALGEAFKVQEFVDTVGAEVLQDSFGTAPQAFTGTRAYAAYKQLYEGSFGPMPPDPYVDTAYDAMMVLALAIQQSGSTDSESIQAALRQVANRPGLDILPGEWPKALEALRAGEDIDYVGASGSIEFDRKGDVAGTFGHWVVENNQIVTLEVLLVR